MAQIVNCRPEFFEHAVRAKPKHPLTMPSPKPRPSPDHTIPQADLPRRLLPPELPPWLLTPSDQRLPTGWVHRRP